jgi:hypothetical protein
MSFTAGEYVGIRICCSSNFTRHGTHAILYSKSIDQVTVIIIVVIIVIATDTFSASARFTHTASVARCKPKWINITNRIATDIAIPVAGYGLDTDFLRSSPA